MATTVKRESLREMIAEQRAKFAALKANGNQRNREIRTDRIEEAE